MCKLTSGSVEQYTSILRSVRYQCSTSIDLKDPAGILIDGWAKLLLDKL